MNAPREIRSRTPKPRPGHQSVSSAVVKEQEATFFSLDPQGGTLTWHKRHNKDVSFRLPGHAEPAGLPIVRQVITASLLLDRVLLAYFVFVGTDGRCLHRTAVGLEMLISEMWPDEVMRQLGEYGVLTDSVVARNYHDLNRKFPGASRFWMLRSPGLVVSVVVGLIFLAVIVITVVAVHK